VITLAIIIKQPKILKIKKSLRNTGFEINAKFRSSLRCCSNCWLLKLFSEESLASFYS